MLKYLCFFLIVTTYSFANTIKDEKTSEIQIVEQLIENTKTSLSLQEKILTELNSYQTINKKFLNQPNNNELLVQNVILADRLFKTIKDAHLEPNFSTDFIHELTLFSKIASKKGTN